MSGWMLTRRQCWGLTWRGRLVLLILVMLGCGFMMTEVYPFLSVTERVPSRILVIEGWMPFNIMGQVAEEFRSEGYERAVLIRPVLDLNDQIESGRFFGNWMVALLVQNGVPKERLTTLFPIVTNKDRTYHSALSVKKWLVQQRLQITSINVISQGPHARRSRLLYQNAFGDNCKIGIIALRDFHYDPAHWWRMSEGVREVIGESIAYLYARFLFSLVQS